MKKIQFFTVVLLFVNANVFAEVHVLPDPKKKVQAPVQVNNVANQNQPQPIISIPGSQKAQSRNNVQQVAQPRNNVIPSNDAMIPTQQDNAEDVGVFQSEDDFTTGAMEDVGSDVVYNDLDAIEKNEKKMRNRSRTDRLNLDLRDDSVAYNTIEQTQNYEGCGRFSYEAGLLKPNLQRMLESCGYTIGQWSFGDDVYEFDFPVHKAYDVKGKNLVQLLDQVKTTYLIDYKANQLDKTVDFSPSRGEKLNDLQLKHR